MAFEIAPSSKAPKRLRRAEASRYLKEQWSIDAAPRTMAKWACIGGGPIMEYAGRFPLYSVEMLDSWAKAKISPPVANTSERTQQRVAA